MKDVTFRTDNQQCVSPMMCLYKIAYL